jgi:hypothetical protein
LATRQSGAKRESIRAIEPHCSSPEIQGSNGLSAIADPMSTVHSNTLLERREQIDPYTYPTHPAILTNTNHLVQFDSRKCATGRKRGMTRGTTSRSRSNAQPCAR